MYNSKLATSGWIIFFIGFCTLYLPMFFLGVTGMPRRYYDYVEHFHGPNIVSTIGSWVLILGLVIILYNLIHSAYKGKKADKNPWGGRTLEWTIDSPPSLENFEEIPVIDRGPYDYHKTHES